MKNVDSIKEKVYKKFGWADKSIDGELDLAISKTIEWKDKEIEEMKEVVRVQNNIVHNVARAIFEDIFNNVKRYQTRELGHREVYPVDVFLLKDIRKRSKKWCEK